MKVVEQIGSTKGDMRNAPAADPPRPRVISGMSMIKDLKPIESIVDGLPTGRGQLVAMTGPTGAGKTTVATQLQTCLARGTPFAGREVTRGSVLVLAGENPDDYAMHLAATIQDLGLVPADIARPEGEILVVPGTFSIDYELDFLEQHLTGFGTKLVAVFVDTSAAFYDGGDENDNVAMRRHASMLRELTTLPGRPTVFVLCHPVKSAQRENLLPRGGGAFLAEVDANLTLWKDSSGVVNLHWAGKIRGANFDPVQFELVSVQLEGYKDCRGRSISSVVARHVPIDRVEALEAKAISDENTLLVAMQRKPGESIAQLALACGWTSGAGTPQKSRVHRVLHQLKEAGLVEKDRGNVWRLTHKGRKEAEMVP